VWKGVLFFNPVALPFTLAFLGIMGTWRSKKRIATALVRFARLAARVAYKIFLAIHCEERVQSAFYTAIGVLVGHFSSHSLAGVLIGAVTGFALGWGSYKLISVRLLPKPAAAT
jgi:hypothetical protein